MKYERSGWCIANIYVLAIILNLGLIASHGQDELSDAVRSNDVKKARSVLQGQEIKDPDLKYQLLWTAAYNGNAEICQELVNVGIPPDKVNPKMGTSILKLVIRPNFKIDVESKLQIIDLFERATTNGVKSKLQLKKVSRQEILEELDRMQRYMDYIKSVGPVDFRLDIPDTTGVTRLMKAVAKGDMDMVKFFLRNGAKTDSKDREGRTAMDYICKEVEEPLQKKEKSEAIRKLLKEKDMSTK